MSKVDDLFEQAKRLPVGDREQLAARLLDSLEPPYDEAITLEADDEAELHRRLELVRTGQVRGHTLESVMEGLRAILGKQSVRMTLIILDEARLEINEQVVWYAARNEAVAERLATLFHETVCELAQRPGQFPLMEMRRNAGNVRRARLKNCPLYIPYQVLDDQIYVLAVAHTARRPGYWRARLRTG